jgi:hypothetical protein
LLLFIAKKLYRRNKYIAWLFFKTWHCMEISLIAQPLYPQGKDPCHPLNRILYGPQSQSTHREEKYLLPLLRSESQIVQSVEVNIILTTPSQLPNISNNLEVYESWVFFVSVLCSIIHCSLSPHFMWIIGAITPLPLLEVNNSSLLPVHRINEVNEQNFS